MMVPIKDVVKRVVTTLQHLILGSSTAATIGRLALGVPNHSVKTHAKSARR